MDFVNKIIHGDCEEVLKEWPDNSIDLIFTSPPYADQKKKVGMYVAVINKRFN